MEDGLYLELPDNEYRDINRLSKHDSDDFAKSPYAYQMRKREGVKREPSEAMRLGTALHTKVLQPALWDSQYAIIPNAIKRRAGKEWEAFQAENPGKECLKIEQYTQINAMAQALKTHKGCKDVFECTPYNLREASLLSTINDVEIKSRADIYCPDKNIIVDVKTASDASPDAFMAQASNLGYDVQAAFYIMNAEALNLNVYEFGFYVVETEYPYSVGCYTFSRFSDFILAGECEVKRRLSAYKEYLDSFDNPEPGWTERNLGLPAWNKRLQHLQQLRK